MNKLGIGCVWLSGIFIGMAIGWSRREAVPVGEFFDSESTTERVMARVEEIREARVRDMSIADDGPGKIEMIKQNIKDDMTTYHTVVDPYVVLSKALAGDIIFISPDEYLDDEEYDKYTIEVFRDDINYALVVDGDPVPDLYEYVDDEVLAELTGKTCLFIRNEKKKADYEVTWGQP